MNEFKQASTELLQLIKSGITKTFNPISATTGVVREGWDRDPARGHGDERRLHLRLHGRRVPRGVPPRLGELLRLSAKGIRNTLSIVNTGLFTSFNQ